MASDLVLIRLCSDFSEMPGMHLTETQVSRMSDLDWMTAREALQCLVSIGFLRVDEGDAALPRMSALRGTFRRAN